ncbi:MAG: serine hydrolase [Proteobacteria bacterium]|nr:serine hydrolase [Pseudomonadota bacterium]
MKNDRKRWVRRRLWLVLLLFGLAYLLVIGRAFQLQIVSAPTLKRIARGQIEKPLIIAGTRGQIYDRRGRILAGSKDATSVFARPGRINDPRRAARLLARALGLDRRRLLETLGRGRRFVMIKRRLTAAEIARVRQMKLPGIGWVGEQDRFYPNLTLAAHVLGFTGTDARGLEGLERRYDKVLQGQKRVVPAHRDALGRTIWLSPHLDSVGHRGHNLVLTIDRDLQFKTQALLRRAIEKHQARAGQAVVVDPRTGAVLALAVYPEFDPNAYQQSPTGHRRNRVVTDVFEPGSVFKIFVAAAALQSGKVRATDLFVVEKKLTIGPDVIHDHETSASRRPYPKRLTLAEIVKFSSNIGAVKVGQLVGPAAYHRLLRALGFGRPTGLDFPGEVGGRLRPWRKWRPIEAATMSYGHGVSVTALQLAMAVAAIANNGKLMRPYLVAEITDARGKTIQVNRPKVVRRALSPEVARTLTRIMTGVTTTGGTGVRAAIKGCRVAGKTGTARKPDPAGGYRRAWISTFVGFAPADDPRAVAVVVLDEPQKRYYASEVAAPLFRRIMSVALKIRPQAKVTARADRVKPRPSPRAPVVAPPQQGAGLRTELEQGRLPDLRGHPLRRVLRVAQRLRVPVTAVGPGGWVVRQRPEAGWPVRKTRRLWVQLSFENRR